MRDKIFFCIWLELYINLSLSLQQTEHLTNGDQCEVIDAVIQIYVFDRIYVIYPQASPDIQARKLTRSRVVLLTVEYYTHTRVLAGRYLFS